MSPSHPSSPKTLLLLVVGQVAGVALFGLGFWLLYMAFLRDNVAAGIVGGLLLLAGMWVMARSRRVTSGGER